LEKLPVKTYFSHPPPPLKVQHRIWVLFFTKTCNILKKNIHSLLNSCFLSDFQDFLEHSCLSYAHGFLFVSLSTVMFFFNLIQCALLHVSFRANRIVLTTHTGAMFVFITSSSYLYLSWLVCLLHSCQCPSHSLSCIAYRFIVWPFVVCLLDCDRRPAHLLRPRWRSGDRSRPGASSSWALQ